MMIVHIRRRVDALRAQEHGVSATMFIFSFFMLMGAALLAVDGGLLFLSQRGQVADTDSGALAAARALAADPCATDGAAQIEAERLMGLNDSTTIVEDFDVVRDDPADPCAQSGVVTLATRHRAISIFSGALGFGPADTGVVSQARFGPVGIAEGVRPIGICIRDPHYLEWIGSDRGTDLVEYGNLKDQTEDGDPAAVPPVPTFQDLYGKEAHPAVGPNGEQYAANGHDVHRVVFERLDGNSPCGSGSGSFGWIDFDDGGNPSDDRCPPPNNSELQCRIREGFEGGVDLGPSSNPTIDDEDCAADDPAGPNCRSRNGARGESTRPALDSVVCPTGVPAASCPDILYVIVYDAVVGPPDYFDLTSILGVVLRGHVVLNGQLDGAENYLDIEFVRDVVSGTVAGAADPDYTGELAGQLCGAGRFDNC